MATQMIPTYTGLLAWSVSHTGFQQSRLPKRLACLCQAVCHGSCETVLINTLGHAKSCRMTADVPGL